MATKEIIKHPIENIGTNLKKSAWFSVMESLAILIFGILIVVWPGVTIQVIANILGGVFIIGGIYQIINYFVAKGQQDFFNNSLLSGVLALILGIAALVIGKDLAGIFRIVIGIWIVYESLVRVNTAIKLHSVGIKSWQFVLVIALCMLVIGIFITFNANALMQLIGWMMIASSVFGIVGDFIFIQNVNSVADILTGKAKTK